MKFAKTTIGETVEILAADDFVGIPFKVTEAAAVKAGTPMTLAGKKATMTAAAGDTPASTNADGILLYDVDPAENPNATLVVQGVIDKTKADAHAGVTLDAAALKVAVPGVVLRDNIGVNS